MVEGPPGDDREDGLTARGGPPGDRRDAKEIAMSKKTTGKRQNVKTSKSQNFTKIVLGLALAGLLLPTAGCKYPRGGSYGGSYTDVFVGFDWLPGFGGFDLFDDYVEYDYYEEDFIVIDTGGDYYYEDEYYYEDDYYYDDAYWDDGYWDDGYWDDWKKKRAGRRK